jgi:hypothetical protein
MRLRKNGEGSQHESPVAGARSRPWRISFVLGIRKSTGYALRLWTGRRNCESSKQNKKSRQG